MKVAILAGGHDSRLAEETEIRSKPMVEIGADILFYGISCVTIPTTDSRTS
jgi:glucose-1-phosphate cytidylyltransferase